MVVVFNYDGTQEEMGKCQPVAWGTGKFDERMRRRRVVSFGSVDRRALTRDELLRRGLGRTSFFFFKTHEFKLPPGCFNEESAAKFLQLVPMFVFSCRLRVRSTNSNMALRKASPWTSPTMNRKEPPKSTDRLTTSEMPQPATTSSTAQPNSRRDFSEGPPRLANYPRAVLRLG